MICHFYSILSNYSIYFCVERVEYSNDIIDYKVLNW